MAYVAMTLQEVVRNPDEAVMVVISEVTVDIVTKPEGTIRLFRYGSILCVW